MSDSILEQIIDSQKQDIVSHFQPEKLLEELLCLLDERERKVLDMRYGLSEDEKNTLESIGKHFSITRERVRQIEATAIKKILESDEFTKNRDELVSLIEDILDEVGGVMAEDRLVAQLQEVAAAAIREAILKFVLHKLLAHDFVVVKPNDHMVRSWALPSASLEYYREILEVIYAVLYQQDEIHDFDALHSVVHEHPHFEEREEIAQHIFENLLHMSAKVNHNPFRQWGLANWSLIKPKRMNDKIYLVLKNHGKPAHFTDIATMINEINFDHKRAHPATVHNELILDNDRYVLVGRGIYALKEWGYKPGVVTDIITDLLKKNGPMVREDIVEQVLSQRIVKRSTIILMLTNKQLFVKLPDGRYDVVTES